MHLLHYNEDGTYGFTEFLHGQVPPYAILSHTWGADSEEVTHKDILESTAQEKIGWNKIWWCGEQAMRDGLQYFWVDTCCIDKTSSAELSEAINSMFRWYSEACRCYVYLSDVADSRSRNEMRSALSRSRWFTRGWTLQELIAPACVQFFSSGWCFLGDKNTLEPEICRITGIDYNALRGQSLSDFSVEQRMSWAVKRHTTRKEDKAYSLLGIFGVHMPLIYGEEDAAFARLSEAIVKQSAEDNNYLLQLALAPNQYNCFEPIRAYRQGLFRSIRMANCSTCNWTQDYDPVHDNKFRFHGERRSIPTLTLWQRFHYNQEDESVFRCYICRDGANLIWEDMKDHIRNCHTYDQVCE